MQRLKQRGRIAFMGGEGIGVEQGGAFAPKGGGHHVERPRHAKAGTKAERGDPAVGKMAAQGIGVGQGSEHDGGELGGVFGQCRLRSGQRHQTGADPERGAGGQPRGATLARTTGQDECMAVAVFMRRLGFGERGAHLLGQGNLADHGSLRRGYLDHFGRV